MGDVLLNFDLEEFDLLGEYNLDISEKQKFEFSFIGLKKLLNLLDKHDISVTFFVTASFAKKYPKLIKKISNKYEVASHNLNHQVNKYNEEEVKKSKKIIEKMINKPLNGFRMPRLQKTDYSSLSRLGFKYDSSVSPTYLPGRYNNYFKKRKITKRNGIFEIPLSTTPIIKIPLYWIFFRFFGLRYAKIATLFCIKNPGFVNIFFHPWEFNDLNKLKIPFYIKKNSGDKALKMLEDYILWCKKKNYEFYNLNDFLKKYKNGL